MPEINMFSQGTLKKNIKDPSERPPERQSRAGIVHPGGQHSIVSLPHRQIVTLTNTFAKIIS